MQGMVGSNANSGYNGGDERPAAAAAAPRRTASSIFAKKQQNSAPVRKPSTTVKARSMSNSNGAMMGMAVSKKPSLFGAAKPKPQTGSPFGKATSSNAMTSQIIPTIKTLHQEIMAQLSEIKGLVAQGGIAATTANLQGAQPQLYNNSGQDGGRRRATLARRGTKRRGRGRA